MKSYHYNGQSLLLTQGTKPFLLLGHFGQAQALQMVTSITLIAKDLNKENDFKNNF